MPRTIRKASSTGFYHVMQRGTGKQNIFECNEDYLWYLKKLERVKDKLGFELISYCLMRNHTHLLIRAGSVAQLSQIMQCLGTGYATYYNTKYDHVGYVFQDRFLSEPIESERYLLACVRYIHNNPVKAKLSSRASYPWSSYNEYLCEGVLVSREPVIGILNGIDEFVKFSNTRDDIVFNDLDNDEEYYAVGLRIIADELGLPCENGVIVKSLNKEVRNRIISKLKAAGLSLKKIERLTGVPKSILNRVGSVLPEST